MDDEDVVLPGARDVRGTLDRPGSSADRETAVVACPPHPQFGGSRTDRRLRGVAEALGDASVATLRFDYGPWDGGRGERTDVEQALDWARDRFAAVGLFGYSFGAVMAAHVAGGDDPAGDIVGVSLLAPDADALDALTCIDSPLQVLYGTRDDTVNWAPVVEEVRAFADEGRTVDVVECEADHHFVGQHEKVGDAVARFFADRSS